MWRIATWLDNAYLKITEISWIFLKGPFNNMWHIFLGVGGGGFATVSPKDTKWREGATKMTNICFFHSWTKFHHKKFWISFAFYKMKTVHHPKGEYWTMSPNVTWEWKGGGLKLVKKVSRIICLWISIVLLSVVNQLLWASFKQKFFLHLRLFDVFVDKLLQLQRSQFPANSNCENFAVELYKKNLTWIQSKVVLYHGFLSSLSIFKWSGRGIFHFLFLLLLAKKSHLNVSFEWTTNEFSTGILTNCQNLLRSTW